MSKHYIRHDINDRVIKGFSDTPEFNNTILETDTCICQDGGRHFEWDGVINPPMHLKCGCPKYKNLMELMTEEDIAQWKTEQPITKQLLTHEQMDDLLTNYFK